MAARNEAESKINNVLLYEEYRLVERSETYVNRAWKGAHLLLFFLAFVFGSFCTFCFHMLMYLFDEKCVLFPKLLSLTSMRHNVIYEFMPSNNDLSDLPVDFVSTQWVEQSTCALPTYVPLVSGIFGLVWTTIFLMCSTGTRTLTGLQRPWRVLPPVFVFSLAMSILCIYSSVVTHSGLQELCVKLGEITGTSTCRYAVNVVTLVYERRIRGVYQATRLTIVSAWLHTACWLCSALLTLFRVVLAVDFQLVRIKVTLRADIDRLMERNETQVRTVSPDEQRMRDKYATTNEGFDDLSDVNVILKTHSNFTISSVTNEVSEMSLVPTEKEKLERMKEFQKLPEEHRFILKTLYDQLDKITTSADSELRSFNWDSLIYDSQESLQYEDTKIDLKVPEQQNLLEQYHISTIEEIENIVREIINSLIEKIHAHLVDILLPTSTRQLMFLDQSVVTHPDEVKPVNKSDEVRTSSKNDNDNLDEYNKKKSNLTNTSSQTEDEKKKNTQKRVLISEKSFANDEEIDEGDKDTNSPQSQSRKPGVDKETQTQKKEKQD